MATVDNTSLPLSFNPIVVFLFSPLVLMFSTNAYAGDIIAEQGGRSAAVRWFSDVGLGTRTGVVIAEKSTGLDFDMGYAVGVETRLAILEHRLHRVALGVGYLSQGNSRSGGTSQIGIETSFQRFDAALGYDFTWRLLLVEARLGVGVNVATVEMRRWDVGYRVAGETLEYDRRENLETKIHVLETAGFIGGLGVGLDVGEPLFERQHAVELVLHGDYFRRGERDEIFAWLTVRIWLGGLTRKADR